MTTDNYDPTTALSPYYTTRDSKRANARLWAVEKALHDLAEVGIIGFFKGPAGNPTTLPGYASDKLWLKQSPGVQTTPGTVHYWNQSSPASSEANWPVLTPDASVIGAAAIAEATAAAEAATAAAEAAAAAVEQVSATSTGNTSKTSNYTVLTGDTSKHFDNLGASGAVTFSLPGAAAGLLYTFTVAAAQLLSVTAASGDTIYVSGTASSTAGTVRSNLVGSSFTLYAVDANTWVVKSIAGAWSVTT